MKNALEIGVIGCGNIGTGVHLPILSSLDTVRIAFIADTRDPKDVAKLYKVPGVKPTDDLSSLPACDVVVLAIPVGVREEYIKEFSRRGTAIFSEKPFALNATQHRTFLSFNDRMTCNYASIYSNAVRQLREIIRSNVFGELREAVITEGGLIGRTGLEKDHYQTDVGLSGGGILIERGCHAITVINFLFEGYTLKTEKATAICQGKLDLDVEAHICVRGPGVDAMLRYHISYIRPVKNLARFVFQYGTVEFNHTNFGPPIAVKTNRNHFSFSINPDPQWARSRKHAFYLKWNSFLKAIVDKSSLNCELETSLATTLLIEDIYRTGRVWQRQD